MSDLREVFGSGPMSETSEPDWSRNCVDVAGGEDAWILIGGRPNSWREAAAIYRRLGVKTLADAVTALLGKPLSSPKQARRGDIIMVRGSLGRCCGEVAECLGAVVKMRDVDLAWPRGKLGPSR